MPHIVPINPFGRRKLEFGRSAPLCKLHPQRKVERDTPQFRVLGGGIGPRDDEGSTLTFCGFLDSQLECKNEASIFVWARFRFRV